MADRFPLIVNAVSRKIEEIASGDRIDFTGNGIVVSGDGGSGKYLTSNGNTVFWGTPGDVYLTQSQTITNKIFESCSISGITSVITNISNSSLVNSSITINGVPIQLGSSVVTPDNNTTYSVSAVDGGTSAQKIIRLTSGGSGTVVTDDITLTAGSNVTLSRVNDEITINSSYVDTNTITEIRGTASGNFVTGQVTIAQGGSTTVSQSGNTITISSTDNDTITRLKGGISGSFVSGDVSILQSGATTVTQSGNNITVSSENTITTLQSSDVTGTAVSGAVTIAASGASSVSQSGNTITIASTDTNTVTRLRGSATGTYQSGDVTIIGAGSSIVTQVGNDITITSTDTDTTYQAGNGLVLSGTSFSIRNTANLTNNKILKWDSSNVQMVDSLISDDGTTVSISGNLTVTGTTTTINTTNLSVADSEIELRRGNNIVGANGGIKINRTTDGAGAVLSYNVFQWFESGAYWRVFDGTTANRIVTENEVQTLTNKTLTSPTLTTPSLGAATASTINKVTITTPTNSATLTIADGKTLTCNRTLTFSGTDGSTVGFGTGGTVAYRADKLSVFASTTSTEFRGVISDETGVGAMVFAQSPTFVNGVLTSSTTFDVFNTTATTVNAFGSGTAITIGASTGTTTIKNSLSIEKNTTIGLLTSDTLTINATASVVNSDLSVRGIKIGLGLSGNTTNMIIGVNSGSNFSSGTQNTGVGYDTLFFTDQGENNTALGYAALRSASTGSNNTAIGRRAARQSTLGSRNVALGTNALESSITGNDNICIGYYAGAGLTGSGNVIIGSSPNASSVDPAYQPLSQSGNNQLVIASGSNYWIRGDSSYNVTVSNDLTVTNNLNIGGNLIVEGSTTTLNINTLTVDDKNIELASVTAVLGRSGNISVTGIVTGTNTNNLYAGQSLSKISGTGAFGTNPTILSIDSDTQFTVAITAGAFVAGSITFDAGAANDDTADGAGFTILGTTNKTFNWIKGNLAFTSSENIDLASGKVYRIGNAQVLSATTLGSGVTSSSLTSLGTLTSLTVTGAITANGGINLGDNDFAFFGADNDLYIGHNGSINVIADVGTGDLYIANDNALLITNAAFNENKAVFNSNGSVELYFDNSKKFETTSTGVSITGDLTVSTTTNLKQITETSVNNFSTTLSPSSGTLTVDTSAATVVLGDLNASVTTWAFTNVPASNSKATTVTLIIDGDTAQTYGDACSVNGSAVSGGVKWSGGSAPTATNNFDVITFTIVKDSAGTINVFGSGNTNFS
jgi:hypothetical protein